MRNKQSKGVYAPKNTPRTARTKSNTQQLVKFTNERHKIYAGKYELNVTKKFRVVAKNL